MSIAVVLVQLALIGVQVWCYRKSERLPFTSHASATWQRRGHAACFATFACMPLHFALLIAAFSR